MFDPPAKEGKWAHVLDEPSKPVYGGDQVTHVKKLTLPLISLAAFLALGF